MYSIWCSRSKLIRFVYIDLLKLAFLFAVTYNITLSVIISFRMFSLMFYCQVQLAISKNVFINYFTLLLISRNCLPRLCAISTLLISKVGCLWYMLSKCLNHLQIFVSEIRCFLCLIYIYLQNKYTHIYITYPVPIIRAPLSLILDGDVCQMSFVNQYIYFACSE